MSKAFGFRKSLDMGFFWPFVVFGDGFIGFIGPWGPYIVVFSCLFVFFFKIFHHYFFIIIYNHTLPTFKSASR
jgi:hypothetical protein